MEAVTKQVEWKRESGVNGGMWAALSNGYALNAWVADKHASWTLTRNGHHITSGRSDASIEAAMAAAERGYRAVAA